MTVAELRDILSDGRYPNDAVLVVPDRDGDVMFVFSGEAKPPTDFQRRWLRDFYDVDLPEGAQVIWL